MSPWFRRVALAVVATVVLLPWLAAYAAVYRAQYTITESSGNAYAMLPVWVTAPNTWMTANGFFRTDALDTRVETLSGAARPHMVASSRTLTAVAVPASSQTNLYFTTESSVLESMYVIVGDGGRTTTFDDATLEPGASDFSIEWSGYFDATETGAILRKDGEYGLYVATAGTVIGQSGVGAPADENLLPNAAGDLTGLTPFPGAPNWDTVNDPVGVPDEDATYVYIASGGVLVSGTDYYNLPASAIPMGSLINSVTVYWRARAVLANNAWVQPLLRIGAGTTTGTNTQVGGVAYADFSEALARPGGGGWAVEDLADLQVGIILSATGAGEAGRATQVYVQVNYSTPTTVSTAVASGEHTIQLTKTGAAMDLIVDGGAPVNGAAGNPTDADTSIIGMEAGPVAYTEYANLYIGGVPVLLYRPNTIVNGQAYSTGTVTVTNGDATVVGAGGATWTSATVDSLFVSADGVRYTVASITDATHLELTTAYGGGTLAGQDYDLYVRLPNRGTGIVPYSTASDGYIQSTNASYATARTAAAGTAIFTASVELWVGQWFAAALHHVFRGYLYFDTAPIPNDAVVQTARLRLYLAGDQSTQDFDIVVQNGQPAHPTDPLVIGEFDQTFYGSAIGGALNTTAVTLAAYNDIELTSTGLGWINLTGDTRLMLRSSRDLAGTATPLGAEFVVFSSTDMAGTAQDPILEVTYTTTPTLNDAAVTWGSNPAGVTVTLGGMEAVAEPTTDTTTDPARDVLPASEYSDWFLEPAVGGILLTNPFRPMVTMVSDNSALSEIQVWRLYAFLLIFLVTVATAAAFRDHLFVVGAAMSGAVLAAVALTIFPVWALVFAIGSFVGGLVAERTLSL